MDILIILGLVFVLCGTPSFLLLAPYFGWSRWRSVAPFLMGLSMISAGYFS
jgi:hypothetical protein